MTDLDEMGLQVRDQTAKIYIQEAISAYRIGLYRSAVVSTWIAIVNDVIGKLRELAGQGNAAAAQKVDNIDKAIESRSIAALMKIEEQTLELARSFEFVGPLELENLARLKYDRNLAAHPAFGSLDQLFQPTPELVRAHIVHALRSLLITPPTQGKSALDRLKFDLSQPSMPSDREMASKFLSSKYLEHAKESLVRNVMVWAFRELMSSNAVDERTSISLSNVLYATWRTHPDRYSDTMRAEVSRIGDVDDEVLVRLLFLMSFYAPQWNWLDKHIQVRLEAIVDKYPLEWSIAPLEGGIKVPELQSKILGVLDSMPLTTRMEILAISQDPSVINKAIEWLERVGYFRGAEIIQQTLYPLHPQLTSNHVRRIVLAAKANDQVHYASGTPALLADLFDNTVGKSPELFLDKTRDAWREFQEFVATNNGEGDYYSYPSLTEKMKRAELI